MESESRGGDLGAPDTPSRSVRLHFVMQLFTWQGESRSHMEKGKEEDKGEKEEG